MEILETGIKVIDLRLLFQGRGGLSVSRCRQTALWAHPQYSYRARAFLCFAVSVAYLEGNELWQMTESGVLDKTALVFGQMNEPPGG